MRILTSWDDFNQNNWRLAYLLKKYKLPAIFFIEAKPEAEQMVRTLSGDFEIGGHGITHAPLRFLPLADQEWEIKECKKRLENWISKKIEWFCYPRCKYNQGTVELVKRAGFKKARIVTVLALDEGEDPYRIPTTIQTFQREEYKGQDWLIVAKRLFAYPAKNGYYHLWGHSWEIEKNNEWDKLEELFKYISPWKD